MLKNYLLSTLFFILSCTCSNRSLVGTTSETDTGCVIAGLIRYSDSTPSVRSDVILHDQRLIKVTILNTVAASPVLIRSGHRLTNINGFYQFDSVDTGRYLVEINDHDTLGAILRATINPKDTFIQVNGTLKRCGTIIGRVDTTGFGTNRHPVIFLPEIGRKISVDSAGNFIIRNLPEWDYLLRLAISDTIIRKPNDTILIPVRPADTTRINSFGSKFGTVIINGKIIEYPNH